MSSSGDLWYVKLASGDVHRVTLDQLDEAFQAGHVDENTMVLAANGTRWMKLGDAAGLDDAPAPAPAPAPVAAAAPSRVVAAPAAVVAPGAAPIPVAYVAPRTAQAPLMGYPNPSSLRPVSMDLGDVNDLDLDLPFRRGGSRKRWVFAGLGVATLAVVAGVATARPDLAAQLTGGNTGVAAAAAVVAPPPAPVTPPATPAPAPAPMTATNTTTSPSSPGDSPLTPRFTDQQKQKLLDSDKQHDQKSKAHAASHAASTTGGSSHASPRSKSPVFTTSGNKFDPLNSSI
jgi:hypothetical protein